VRANICFKGRTRFRPPPESAANLFIPEGHDARRKSQAFFAEAPDAAAAEAPADLLLQSRASHAAMPNGKFSNMTNAIKQSGAYLEIVSFHLGDQEFCIDIMAIREIRGWAPVTPMPHTPPYVLGLINLRGAVIPVIDMACRLGMKMTEPSERSAIIVTDIAGKLVGLLVEQVSDMMTIKSEDLQPAPEIIPEAQRAFCRGIVALEKTMVCFLNLDTVIAEQLAQAA
jgi:purine-binding chemotaxis protein CheW